MKTLLKLSVYFLLSASLLIFGYQAVKFSRDTVRIWNLKTLVRATNIYNIKKGHYPTSNSENNVINQLMESEYLTKSIRDPVFTSSTVIMDEFAHTLLVNFNKLSNQIEIIDDLNEKMTILQELSTEPIAPDFVITYSANKNHYEYSCKLESVFLKNKMKEDNGNDDERYEVGTDLTLDTSVKVINDKEVKANNKETLLID